MWEINAAVLSLIQIFLILQNSNGKPTIEDTFNHNTTEIQDLDREEAGVNSSFLETISVLLTVLSPNDTATAFNANTTSEPDYDDEFNSTSSPINELEDDVDSLSALLSSSTESSSFPSSLITDEMEVADSVDESVTATVRMEDDASNIVSTSNSIGAEDNVIPSIKSHFDHNTDELPISYGTTISDIENLRSSSGPTLSSVTQSS